MRVADKMNHRQVVGNLQKNRAELSLFQNQASSQKRITKPSDDPLGATRILESRTQRKDFSQFEKNIISTKAFIEFSEQSLSELGELLIRAKELAIQQASDGGAGPETRKIVALEINQIYSQMLNIGNRKMGDRYLFGGYKTTKAPFDQFGRYHGDNSEIEIPIDKTGKMSMNIPGSHVFFGRDVQTSSAPVPEEKLSTQESSPSPSPKTPLRDPNQIREEVVTNDPGLKNLGYWGPRSVNILSTIKLLENSLYANDKQGVQDSLDFLDDSLDQVNFARAELGSRLFVLNNGLETIQRLQVDSKLNESQIEDVDIYELFNNLNRTQNQLEASMATSGKMIGNSLLDFLR